MRVHRADSRYHQRQQEDDSREKESISLTRPPLTPVVVTIPNTMTCMTNAGISTTQAGQEQYETFYTSHIGKKISRVQYDYRTPNGELFSVVAPTLRECRQKCDEWLAKRNK